LQLGLLSITSEFLGDFVALLVLGFLVGCCGHTGSVVDMVVLPHYWYSLGIANPVLSVANMIC
jgi:hypothetical protein